MSAEVFKVLHRLYKRLNRIKILVRMQTSNASTSIDIFDVFSSRLKEILCKAETEYSRPHMSRVEKVRLAAMQLALHMDHLESMMTTYITSNSRASSAIITVEVQRVENCLQKFDEFRSHEVIFLMYFKVLNFLAKVNYDPLQNVGVAKHWINTAEQMYMELITTEKGEQRFYDCHELFSKSVILMPSTDGFAIVDRLFGQNMQLLDQMLNLDSNEVNRLIESFHVQQNTSIWLGKLLSVIPKLLDQMEYKIAAYFLFIAKKLAAEQVNDFKVKSSIATSWMHYFFGIFDRSKENILKKYTENEMFSFRKSFALKKTGRKTIASGDKTPSVSQSTFNCFETSIPLTPDELRLCANSIECVDDAKDLLSYSIDMVEKLICDGDFSHDPMDFIVHNYQMSDLLSISTILSDDGNECFNFQVQRFEFLRKMIELLKQSCPHIFETLATTFLGDLNEILIDLYSTNFTQMLAHSSLKNEHKPPIRQNLEKKLIDLHEINVNLTKMAKK